MSLLFLLLITQLAIAKQPTALTLISNQNGLQEWQTTIDLDKEDALYADYFQVASDHENLRIISWNHDGQSSEHYEPNFKQNKKIITQPVTIQITTECDKLPKEGNLHVSYYRRSDQKIHHELLTVAQSTQQELAQEINPEKEEVKLPEQKELAPAWHHNLPIAFHICLWIFTLALGIMGIYAINIKHNIWGIIMIALMVFCSFQAVKYTMLYKTNESR